MTARPSSRSRRMRSSTRRDSRSAERGRRLVEDDDAARRRPRPGRRRSPGAGRRTSARRAARWSGSPTCSRCEHLGGRVGHGPRGAAAAARAAASAARRPPGPRRSWPPGRGCRTGRGPGRRSRCPARGRRPASRCRPVGRPSRSVPASRRWTPLMHLMSVDFPAPLSPSSASTSPWRDRRDRPRRAPAPRRTAWSRRATAQGRHGGRRRVMPGPPASTRNRCSSAPRRTSSSTASTMTTPMTIGWRNASTLSRFIAVADHADHQRADECVGRRCPARRGSWRRR